MAELTHKIKLALDEARLLLLGCEVLMGFQFRSFFEKRFEELPSVAQDAKLCSLLIMLVAVMLLILPAAYHRIVEDGEATEHQHQFTTSVMDVVLFPFALVIGLDVYVAVQSVAGRFTGMFAAASIVIVTLFFWYGLEWVVRARQNGGDAMQHDENENSRPTPLKNKIEYVLTECRVVLPGVQALLGFQFATILMEAFPKLPRSSQYIHLLSLGCIALAMVFLMTPAAFHRIVEAGEETDRLHRFASRMLLAALVPLAFGIAGALFVVMRKMTDSVAISVMASLGCATTFLIAWFGFTLAVRASRDREFKKTVNA